MFRSTGAQERVRRMFDEVCESLRHLRDLKSTLASAGDGASRSHRQGLRPPEKRDAVRGRWRPAGLSPQGWAATSPRCRLAARRLLRPLCAGPRGLYPGRWLLYLLLALDVIPAAAGVVRGSKDFRQPLLEALAAEFKLDYDSHDFTPPAWAQAESLLFGESEDASFTDRLASFEDGRAFMVCQAALRTKDGNMLFEGAIYAFDRAEGVSGTTVVLPAGSKAPREIWSGLLQGSGVHGRLRRLLTGPSFALEQIDSELRRPLTSSPKAEPF